MLLPAAALALAVLLGGCQTASRGTVATPERCRQYLAAARHMPALEPHWLGRPIIDIAEEEQLTEAQFEGLLFWYAYLDECGCT